MRKLTPGCKQLSKEYRNGLHYITACDVYTTRSCHFYVRFAHRAAVECCPRGGSQMFYIPYMFQCNEYNTHTTRYTLIMYTYTLKHTHIVRASCVCDTPLKLCHAFQLQQIEHIYPFKTPHCEPYIYIEHRATPHHHRVHACS